MPNKKQPETIDNRRKLTLKESTFDEKNRTIEAVMATETPVLTPDFHMNCMVDEILLMSGARFPAQVPLLDTHDDSTIEKQLGSTRNIRVDGGNLIGLRTFAETEAGNRAMALIKGGHLKDGSIRYRYSNPIYVPVGETVTIGNRTFTAPERPKRIAAEWELLEDSVCPIGADKNAKMRKEIPAEKPAENQGGSFSMNKKLYDLLILRGLAPGSTDAEALAFITAMPKTDQENIRAEANKPAPAAVPPVDVEAIRKEEKAKFVQYSGEVNDLCRRHGLEAMAQGFIDKDVKIEDVRAKILDKLEETRKPVDQHIEKIADEVDKFRAAAVDGIILSRGLPIAKPAEGSEHLRRLGFVGMARLCLEQKGIRTSHMDNEQILLTALGKRIVGRPTGIDGKRTDGGLSTSDFDYVLANSANKVLMIGYAQAPATWRVWCSKGSNKDFKASARVRASDLANFREVKEGANIKNVQLSDTGENVTLATYAENLAFTRQALINDDLGAFDPFRTMGFAVASTINALPYTLLLANAVLADTGALFNATAVTTTGGHANYTASGAAVSSTTWSDAEIAMLNQTGPKGSKLQIAPKFILTGSTHKTNAWLLIHSTSLPVAEMSSGVGNPNQGIIHVLDTNITGTNWFAAADPGMAPGVEVCFLNGVETPTMVETVDQSVILGTTYTCYFDAVSKALDFRSLYWNPGA